MLRKIENKIKKTELSEKDKKLALFVVKEIYNAIDKKDEVFSYVYNYFTFTGGTTGSLRMINPISDPEYEKFIIRGIKVRGLLIPDANQVNERMDIYLIYDRQVNTSQTPYAIGDIFEESIAGSFIKKGLGDKFDILAHQSFAIGKKDNVNMYGTAPASHLVNITLRKLELDFSYKFISFGNFRYIGNIYMIILGSVAANYASAYLTTSVFYKKLM